MPARNRIPSFQIASGTANERDTIYNMPTGSIFFNTDTSNIEVSGNVVAPMIDVSTSVSAATINATTSISAPSINSSTSVTAPSINATTSISAPSINATTITGVNSISFSDGSSPVKTTDPQNINGNKTFNNLVTMQGGLDFPSTYVGSASTVSGITPATWYSSTNGGQYSKYVSHGCMFIRIGKFYLLSFLYAGYNTTSAGFLPWSANSVRAWSNVNWHESGSGLLSDGQAIYTQGTPYINFRSPAGTFPRGTFLLMKV